APFVGVLRERPKLVPNPAEVARVFDVALAELLEPNVYHQERWDLPGMGERPMHFFDVAGETVWGATARVLHDLLTLVTDSRRWPSSAPVPPPRPRIWRRTSSLPWPRVSAASRATRTASAPGCSRSPTARSASCDAGWAGAAPSPCPPTRWASGCRPATPRATPWPPSAPSRPSI